MALRFPFLTRTFYLLLFLALSLTLLACTQKEKGVRFLCYTLLCETDEASADALSVGDKLSDAVGKGEMGEVIKITRTAAYAEDAHGLYPQAVRVRLAIELATNGATDGGIPTVGGVPLRCGTTLYLMGRTTLEGTCVRVRVL